MTAQNYPHGVGVQKQILSSDLPIFFQNSQLPCYRQAAALNSEMRLQRGKCAKYEYAIQLCRCFDFHKTQTRQIEWAPRSSTGLETVSRRSSL